MRITNYMGVVTDNSWVEAFESIHAASLDYYYDLPEHIKTAKEHKAWETYNLKQELEVMSLWVIKVRK